MKFIPTFKNVLIVVLLLALLYLLTCKKKRVELPQVKSVTEQKEIVRVDSVMSQATKDSVTKLLKDADKAGEKWFEEWKVVSQQYDALEKGMGDLLSEEVPDTCKAIQERLVAQYLKEKKSNDEKDIACSNTIASKNSIIFQKDRLIQLSKNDYGLLKVRLDTAWAQQEKLQRINKKLLPKRELSIGLVAISNYNTFDNAAAGVVLDYRNKRGTQFGAGVFNTKQILVSYKKPILKF
jgi:hypothetical protein